MKQTTLEDLYYGNKIGLKISVKSNIILLTELEFWATLFLEVPDLETSVIFILSNQIATK